MTLAEVVERLTRRAKLPGEDPPFDLGRVDGIEEAIMFIENDPDFTLRERVEEILRRAEEFGDGFDFESRLRELLEYPVSRPPATSISSHTR